MEKVRTVAKNTLDSPSKILGFLILFLVAGGILAYTLSQGFSQPDQSNQQNSGTDQPSQGLSDNTIVYGSWTENDTTIKAYDLSTGKEYLLATLPSNIKKISILNNERILYISDTDTKDRGSKITIRNLKTQEEGTYYESTGGYGIDDYVISPDNRLIAIWELRNPGDTNILIGGSSRVITRDLSSTTTNTLYQEQISEGSQIHYPVAITNEGEVFLDTFVPNSGDAWAHGMTVSNFDGSSIQPLSQMANGTYGTKPTLSPDGSMLTFAGYDGSKGPGTNIINGYRRAALTTNTIETLSTGTKTRQKLPNVPNNNLYVNPNWGNNGNIYTHVATQESENSGLYRYDLASNTLHAIAGTDSLDYETITSLGNNMTLVGLPFISLSAYANVGEKYAYPYSSIAVYDAKADEMTKLPLSSSLIRYFTIYPSSVANAQIPLEGAKEITVNSAEAQLELRSFPIPEPSLAEERLVEHTSPPRFTPPQQEEEDEPEADEPDVPDEPDPTPTPKDCPYLIVEKCTELHPGDHVKNPELKIERQKCAAEHREIVGSHCMSSPLYLYGTTGTKVNVKYHTSIFNEKPAYNGQYNITLLSGGKMLIDGDIYQSITYDYTPALRKISPPKYGKIVRRSEIKNVITEYGKRLGLRENEIQDIIQKVEIEAHSLYIFLSFFDQKTSKYLLPISFNPQPDTYINYVFYVKNLTSPKELGYSPREPEFPKIEKREKLTAVEVSVISE